jgi:hypothetical protein
MSDEQLKRNLIAGIPTLFLICLPRKKVGRHHESDQHQQKIHRFHLDAGGG